MTLPPARWFVAICLLLVVPAAVRGQAPPAPIVGEADLRIGGIWPTEAEQSLPSFGGRLALWPWLTPGGDTRRINIQVIGDFRRLDRIEQYDVDAGGPTVTKRNLFLLGPAVGVDLLRSSHLQVDARAGGSLVAESRSFGYDIPGGDFTGVNNLCAFEFFRDRCGIDWGFAGVLGLGVRVVPIADGRLYFGVDYGWLTRNQHQMAGTVGIRLR
jgi:hypothetical protein